MAAKKDFYKHTIDPLSRLVPYAKNARTHSDKQIQSIAKSIKEFGFTNPVLIDEKGGIIAGHGRVMAAQTLDIKHVPCITLAGLSKAQKKAYIIADNQLPMGAEWDTETLRAELQSLQDFEFDIDLLGFDESFLDDLLQEENPGKTGEDEIPEPPVNPVTVEGDLWILGNHRLLCGDSTSIDAVERLMDGNLADFSFTSPPYGQQRQYKKQITDWYSMMEGVYSILPVKDSAQILVNLGLIHSEKEWQPYWDGWIEHIRKNDWLRFALYIWDQGAGMMGDHHGRLSPSFELIFHFCKENLRAKKTVKSKLSGKIASSKGQRGKDGSVKERTGAGKPIQKTKVRDSVIRVNRQLSISKAGGHPAPFPVELCRELSLPWVNKGDTCYEPFTGSGTQIINCENEGFVFYGMELAAEYVDIAINRWQNYTGEEAKHENGKTFKQLTKKRFK